MTLYHADVIRRQNGGHLFAEGKIGGIIIEAQGQAAPQHNRRVCRRWTAVAMTAIGGGCGPGVYFGTFSSREEAEEAASRYMLAGRRGWFATREEAEAEVRRMIAADPRRLKPAPQA